MLLLNRPENFYTRQKIHIQNVDLKFEISYLIYILSGTRISCLRNKCEQFQLDISFA